MIDANVDWATVRLQYELYGATLDVLSEQYDIPISVLEYAVDEEGWKQIKVAKAARQDWHDVDQLQEVGDGLIDDVKARLRIMQTVKESALSPRYIMLETAILSKARDIINNIHPEAPLAGQLLKQVSEVIEKMRAQNDALRPTPVDNGSGGGNVNIQILGRVSPVGGPDEIHEISVQRVAEIGHDCSPQLAANEG